MAFSPAAAYALERKGVEYSDVRRYYSHNELWNQYPAITKRAVTLSRRLDELLYGIDDNYKREEFDIFNYFLFALKISLDQLIYFVYVLKKVLASTGATSIRCATPCDPVLDREGLYEDGFSLLGLVACLMKDAYGFKIEFMKPSYDNKNSAVTSSSFSFGQPWLKAKLKRPAKKIIGMAYNLKNRISSGGKVSLLSVDCAELNSLTPDFRKAGWEVLNYYDDIDDIIYQHSTELEAVITNDIEVRELLKYEGVDLFPVISRNIFFLVASLGGIYEGYKRARRFLDSNAIDAAFLLTVAPFYPVYVFIANLCAKRGIPLFIWMHGGFGAYYSLPGYDVVDFRLGKFYCAYGSVIKDTLYSSGCVNRTIGNEPLEVFVAGSPFLEKKYKNYKRLSNSKKEIMLVIGNYYKYNTFYFGYNRPYAEFCNWDEHKAIIRLLVKYQKKYNITVKDYPASNMTPLWDALLADLGGSDIKVVSHEKSFKDLLMNSDLNIFTWVSTTFFESLFSDADCFLLDNSDITDEALSLLGRYTGFSNDREKFLNMLDAYLDKGEFYKQEKTVLREHFLDLNNKDNRSDAVMKIVNDVLVSNKTAYN